VIREGVLSSVSNGHLLRTEGWAYMRYNNGSEELYDMAPAPQGDPLQFTNLVSDPLHATQLQELRAMLDARLQAVVADSGFAYCFGDGTGETCPCSGWGGPGEGCMTSSGTGATLTGTGLADLSSDGFVLTTTGGPPGSPGLLFHGLTTTTHPLGSGILCAVPAQRYGVRALDASGSVSYSGLSIRATAGATHYYQHFFRDVNGPCSGGFNSTNGWQVIWN